MEQMQKMMTANPELIERLAKEQGLDPAQARAAATRFTSLDESAQRDLIARASAGLESGASATQIAASIGRTPARRNANSERAAAKRKAAARARRQNTKKRSR
jgi:hypothetical protein